jgi:hypothetical protein
VANADGSIIECIKYLQSELAGTGIEGKVDDVLTAIGTPTATDISTDVANVQTEVDKIGTPAADLAADIAAVKLQTDEIGSAVGASIAADIAAVKLQTDEIGSAAGATISADIAAVSTLIGTPAADVAADIAAVSTLIGTPAADVAADIAAVKLQTDEIGSAVGASISADIAAVQTEVDKIGTPAGADVSTDIAGNKTAIDNFAAAGGFGKALVRKTVTFSNTNSDVDLFTVTGAVIARTIAVCTTSLASAGTCNMSVFSGVTTIIAQTAATDIAAGEIWHDATPDAEAELYTVAPDYIITDGNDIVVDIDGAHQVDSGVIEFYCIYTPLSADGAVAVAA